MQQKISIIIATDFFCWVPFVTVCGLHSMEVLDATPWYALFSILILPINSVINPLLYDNTITDIVSQTTRRTCTFVSTAIASRFEAGAEEIVPEVTNPSRPNQIVELNVLLSTNNGDSLNVQNLNLPNNDVTTRNIVFVDDGEQPSSSNMYRETTL